MNEELIKTQLQEKDRQIDLLIQERENIMLKQLHQLQAKDKEITELKDKIAELNITQHRLVQQVDHLRTGKDLDKLKKTLTAQQRKELKLWEIKLTNLQNEFKDKIHQQQEAIHNLETETVNMQLKITQQEQEKKDITRTLEETQMYIQNIKTQTSLMVNEILTLFYTGLNDRLRAYFATIQNIVQYCTEHYVHSPITEHWQTLSRQTEQLTKLLVNLNPNLYNPVINRYLIYDIESISRAAILSITDPYDKEKIHIIESYTPNLPPIYADPEQLRKTVTQLITYLIKLLNQPENINLQDSENNVPVQKVMVLSGFNQPENIVFLQLITETRYLTNYEKDKLMLPLVNPQYPDEWGLFYAWLITTLHQGYIDVKSNPGTGTIITINLPAGTQTTRTTVN